MKPTPEVTETLCSALDANTRQLGYAFRLMQQGKISNKELVEGGAGANDGAAGNNRAMINAILEGVIPSAPSIAGMAARAVGGLVKANKDFDSDTKKYLQDLRDELEEVSESSDAIEREDAALEEASKELEQLLEDMPGVYIYTLPAFRRVVIKTDPDRFYFKVGMTNRVAGVRIGEQMRATGLPEDPWLARVYQHPTTAINELERKFHRLLQSTGHAQTTGRYSGKEWYVTNLEALDAFAEELGCSIATGEV